MVEKTTIRIGDEDVLFCASAAVALRYKQTFHKDIIDEIASVSMNNSDALDIFELAYCMSDSFGTGEGFEQWLERFSFNDLLDASADIINIFVDSIEPTEEADSKNMEATEK